jgi:hypothetical protein
MPINEVQKSMTRQAGVVVARKTMPLDGFSFYDMRNNT